MQDATFDSTQEMAFSMKSCGCAFGSDDSLVGAEPTLHDDRTNLTLGASSEHISKAEVIVNTWGPPQAASGEAVLPDCHRNIDSLIAATTPDIPNRVDDLLEAVANKDAQLEQERDRVAQLHHNIRLPKQHLSAKQEQINQLEKQLEVLKTKQHKQNRELSKYQKKQEEQRRTSFNERHQRTTLDNENTALRDDNRRLRDLVDHLRDDLAVMSAKCASLESFATMGGSNEPASQWGPSLPSRAVTDQRSQSPWTPTVPMTNRRNGGTRPKERMTGHSATKPMSNLSATLSTSHVSQKSFTKDSSAGLKSNKSPRVSTDKVSSAGLESNKSPASLHKSQQVFTSLHKSPQVSKTPQCSSSVHKSLQVISLHKSPHGTSSLHLEQECM